LSENLTYVYAALLDVLGYRNRLDDDRKRGSLSFKDELQRALDILTSINEVTYNYQAISDTIILTCSQQDGFLEFMNTLKNIFISFLKEELFIRGGVAYSQHFKSMHITYSHAVALAYEIESKTSIFPRVVIDHNIILMLESSQENHPIYESGLICSQNGIYFLNIADKTNWEDIYKYAKSIYIRESNQIYGRENEFLKHVWFENFLFASPFANKDYDQYIPAINWHIDL